MVDTASRKPLAAPQQAKRSTQTTFGKSAAYQVRRRLTVNVAAGDQSAALDGHGNSFRALAILTSVAPAVPVLFHAVKDITCSPAWHVVEPTDQPKPTIAHMQQGVSTVVVIIAILWEDVLVQFEVPFYHLAVVGVTGLLCLLVLLDFVVCCAHDDNDGAAPPAGSCPGTAIATTPATPRVGSGFLASYTCSPCGVADGISTGAILLCLVKFFVLAAAQPSPSAEGPCVSNSYDMTMSSWFGVALQAALRFSSGSSSSMVDNDGIGGGDDGGTAAIAVAQFVLSVAASVRVLKLLVKMRRPLLQALMLCRWLPERAGGVSGTHHPPPPLSGGGGDANGTEKKLSTTMSLQLATTTYVGALRRGSFFCACVRVGRG
jgi:hypothetical protein